MDNQAGALGNYIRFLFALFQFLFMPSIHRPVMQHKGGRLGKMEGDGHDVA